MERGFHGDAPLEGIEWFTNENFNHNNIKMSHLDKIPGVVLLDNVMTSEEYTKVVVGTFSETGDKVIDSAKPVLFRGWSENAEEETKKLGQRIFFSSKHFSNKLWERVQSYVPTDLKITVDNLQSQWKVTGMSERIRFVRYTKGQEFPPHLDDSEVQDKNNRSFLTITFYLELPDAPKKGGELRFLKVTSPTKHKKIVDADTRPGRVIIMPHKCLHMSVPVSKGFKFLIRSNILYTRVPGTDVIVEPGTPNEPPYVYY
eukprot:TRINITY_DN2537_c0_g1_i1.p1 TRINITY_DN2537_c0_g1~~TRINITY_DN2537_c0_g1_i1.p1  ORF type:complete len:258 (-),score=61.61 TRINITY_DN2537_c0_g1_i1:34-807(-)